MHKLLTILYFVLGALCILYYISLRVYIPTGVNMGWILLLAGFGFALVGFLSTRALPGWLRVLWRTLLVLGVAGFIAVEGVVIAGMNARLPKDVDAIIVLGARVHQDGHFSQALQHRVDAAHDYLAENPTTLCVVSGGKGSDEPIAEGIAMRDALVEMGIDKSRIIVEDRSTDTRENLIYSKELLPDDVKTVGIVTNNFHVARALVLAKQLGYDDPKGLAASFTGGALPFFMLREAIGFVYELTRNIIH